MDNNITYRQLDNAIYFAIGQNVTRKPAKEYPNTIVAVIKKDRMQTANNVWTRYNEAVRQAQLKLK
jgi:serine protease inhibitor